MVQFDVPEPEYDRYTNRQLAAVPLAVLAVAFLIIIGFYVVTGAPTALAGGVLVGPFLDLVFLFNYARGLWEALVSRPSADPEGMQR